jgi:preprotein translocase subunit SecE
MKEYIQKSIEELYYKVSWPTWDELQNDSIVVAIASVIIALTIYLMDTSWSSILGAFYSMF